MISTCKIEKRVGLTANVSNKLVCWGAEGGKAFPQEAHQKKERTAGRRPDKMKHYIL